MARRRNNIGVKILLAILAVIGIIFLIDKIAGTEILNTIWEKFVGFIRWIGNHLGGG